MRILFLGDVVGRAGRDALIRHMPRLRERLRPDCMVVNGENAASGHGITMKIAADFFAAGVDVITTGNHVFKQRELIFGIDNEPRLIRPVNYPDGTPGRGFVLHTLADGRKILVVNVMARLFMDVILDDPFAATDRVLSAHPLGRAAQAVLIDFHGEASSEKMAFAHVFDGRASAILGTHTHIPTADEHILPKGTAYQTDAGMCGDYDSVIGVKKEQPIWRFTRCTPSERFSPAEGDATLCGCFVVTDDATGRAVSIGRVQVEGILPHAWPAGQEAYKITS